MSDWGKMMNLMYLGVGLQCCQDPIVGGVLEINVGRLKALNFGSNLFHIAKGTAINVIYAQNVRIRSHGLHERGRDGGTGRKRYRLGAPRFQRGERRFECFTVGVSGSRVFKALSRSMIKQGLTIATSMYLVVSDPVLLICRAKCYRGYDCAGLGVWL